MSITDDPDSFEEELISLNEWLKAEDEIELTEEEIAEATEFFKENYYCQWKALQESESDSDDDEDEPWPNTSLPSFESLLTLFDDDSEDDWIDDNDYNVFLEVLEEIIEANHLYIEPPKYIIKVNVCKFGSYDEENDEWFVSMEYSIHQYPDDSTG